MDSCTKESMILDGIEIANIIYIYIYIVIKFSI